MTKNAYFFIHHGDSSKQLLVVVYTKYEANRSIIGDATCMQNIWPQNQVFETLTWGCNLSVDRTSFVNFKFFLTNKKRLLAQLAKLTENGSF